MPVFVGRNAAIGIAVNGDNSGITQGGTPGNYDFMPIRSFGYEVRQAKNTEEELTVNQEHITDGGVYYTWTLEVLGSYSYREQLLQLIAGGDITTTNAGPYDHDIAIDDELLFGSIKLEYTDQAANDNEVILETFSDVVVNSLEITQDTEQALVMTVSGIAISMSRSNTEASLSTVQTNEPIPWDHLTPSLNGATTYRLGALSLSINQPVSEGEFDLAASTPKTMNVVTRAGMREVTGSMDIRMDDSAYSLIYSSGVTNSWDSTNSFTWNNGEAAAAEREFKITLGDCELEDPGREINTLGRETLSGLAFRAFHASGTAVLNFDTKNSRAQVPDA